MSCNRCTFPKPQGNSDKTRVELIHKPDSHKHNDEGVSSDSDGGLGCLELHAARMCCPRTGRQRYACMYAKEGKSTMGCSSKGALCMLQNPQPAACGRGWPTADRIGRHALLLHQHHHHQTTHTITVWSPAMSALLQLPWRKGVAAALTVAATRRGTAYTTLSC